ncbi:AsmA-like C-terminal region-containing protein [Chitinophaga sp. Cy-1792]|uniref:AsmA family protein n=1 Tax=Chitinophaga sp. Cy-1792 TaxID=2608339 RepID=UPI00141DD8FD|nr:AsmA-like C-terminal region-containing protein [Chitinophaga sp. Cy-1792]NIG56467.1 AsmA family protein [Chitinophaga sp. Cy-1792]
MKTGKRILRIAGITLAALLLIIAIAAGILYSQQQRLTQMAVKELNKQFTGELVLGSSNINPFAHFPYISIVLHDVKFYANKKMDTPPMYQVEKLFVGFSLPDILRQHYKVRILVLNNGEVHINRKTNGNLDIVEAHTLPAATTTPADTAAEAMIIDLRKIVLKNILVTYHDDAGGYKVKTHLDKVTTGFSMNAEHMALDLESKMELDFISKTDTTLFRNKHLALNISGDYHLNKKLLQLQKANIKLEDASLDIKGSASLAAQTNVDLSIKGDRPDLNLLFAMVPADIASRMTQYRRDGRVFFDGTIKGQVDKTHMPAIDVHFGCENVWFENKNVSRKLDSLGFRGYYTNGPEHSLKTSELHILDMNARPGKGVFKGNFIMKDFTDPHIIMQLYSELNIRFIGEFLGIKDLEQIEGDIRLNMNFRELVDMQVPEKSLAKLKDGVQSELTVTNLAFRIPNYPLPVRNMNVHAMVKDGSLQLDTLNFKIGQSDLAASGSLSDLPAIFHKQSKPVRVTFQVNSNKVLPGELMLADTTHKRLREEVISGFRLALAFETSVNELLHPNPLPKGVFKIEELSSSFKQYPHSLHDFAADVTIGDTSLLVKNFSGNIDSSNFAFKGRLTNYALWFDKIKKGQTEFAFDLKSDRLAVNDLISSKGRQFIPQGYWYEQTNNLWLRAKLQMKYDTVFKRVDAHIANISGTLKQHPIQLENIKGRIRYGTNKYLVVDTLTGKVGQSDFDINLQLFAGPDRKGNKRNNLFSIKSKYLNVDEMMNYDFSDHKEEEAATTVRTTTVRENDSLHASGFNIFKIKFSNFDVSADVGKIRYHKLWIKNLAANIHMQEDQKIKIDTIDLLMAGGHIGMRGVLNASDPQKLYFRSSIGLDTVNLSKMLLKFDNFGQDMILNKNLQGTLSGRIKSNIKLHPDLTPRLDETKAVMDIEIRNGSLIDFGPMQAMASYFKDKNLRMIRFDTLRNKLNFEKAMLEIPNMSINSSIGYIEISGKQALDLTMAYQLRVPMKMVTSVGFQALFGKKQEEVDADQVDAIESLDKGKKGRFMHLNISGTPDKYHISLGKKKK